MLRAKRRYHGFDFGNKRMNREQYEKYSRQILFAGIGEAGQEKLLQASAVLVGCGALGTVAANLLVRAGIGRLRIIDRDFVEPSNLQRQTLFEESDARDALPKAVAAERRLRAINSDVEIEGIVADLRGNATRTIGQHAAIFSNHSHRDDFAFRNRSSCEASNFARRGHSLPMHPRSATQERNRDNRP